MAPPRRWIRLDAEWDESEWIDALDGHAANCWPRLLTWAKLRVVQGRVKAPSLAVLARRWKVDTGDVERLVAAALEDGAIVLEGEEWVFANWDEYQKPDPTATERKRRQRSKSETPAKSKDTKRHAPSRRDSAGHGVTGMSRPGPVARDVDVDVERTDEEQNTMSYRSSTQGVAKSGHINGGEPRPDQAPPGQQPTSHEGKPAKTPDPLTGEHRKAARLAIQEHLHLGRPPPQTGAGGKPWTMRNEMSIWLQLAKQHGPDEVTGAVVHARKALRFRTDQQLTMRIFNAKGKRDTLNECIAEWRKHRARRAAADAGRIGNILADLTKAGGAGS